MIGGKEVQTRPPERRSEVGKEQVPSGMLQWSSNMCRDENARVSLCMMVCGAR
jgi:hypothetical protein